ncbi:aldo/keto reductase [Thermaurantiacus sp.]
MAAAVAAAHGAGFGMVCLSDHPFPGSGLRFGEATKRVGAVFKADPALRGGWLLALRGGMGPSSVPDSEADSLEAGLEAALARLGAPRTDLFLLEQPDRLAHPRKTAAALARLVQRGLASAVGVANHPSSAIRALAAYLEVPLAAIELSFSALDIDSLLDGTLDLAMELGATVLAAAPLSEGQIGDRPGLAASVTARATIRALDAVAGQQGVGRAAVAAAFVASHAARPVPLFGTQEPAELRAAPDLFRVRLEQADWYRILHAAQGGH